MVRTNATLIAIVTILAAASAGIWFLISEKQEAQERRAKFFGSSNDHIRWRKDESRMVTG